MKRKTILAFDDVRMTESGVTVAGCRLRCAQPLCHSVIIKRNANGNGSELMASRFRREGWEFDINRPRSVVCPKCIIARGHRAEKPPGVVLPAPVVTVKPKPEEVVMNTVTALQSRKLTPDEREKIRDQLDKHFDTERGCYTNGSSDQNIGRSLNVPWLLVKELREIAYGELKADPEVQVLQSTILSMERELSAFMEKAARFETDLNALKAKAETLTKRFTS